MKRVLFVCLILFFCLSGVVIGVYAADDPLAEINKQLADIQLLLDKSRQATKPLEETFNKIEADFQSIERNIRIIENQILIKGEEIEQGERNLVREKLTISTRIRSYYKQSRGYFNNAVGLLLQNGLSEGARLFFYQQQGVGRDRSAILRTAFFITTLEEKKNELETQKKQLDGVKLKLSTQKDFYNTEIVKARKYQGELENQIAQLSARQQQLIASKLASLGIPRSAGTSVKGCSSDLTNGRDPGFSPRVGFFTYGAPHRNGMSQYGAFARARTGQNEEQVLQEYYPSFSLKKDYDQGVQIITTTGWSGSIEDYVKRIYEVPNDWGDQGGMAALKAQAVAARTYALNSMQRNGSICTTESCQVFKFEPKGGRWEEAVNATLGWVLMDGGSPGFTQYASTHGGYILNLNKFDGRDGVPGGFTELNERAYDKESPWFYCNWGSRTEYAGTAWLKPDEVADVFNVIDLARRDSGTGDKLYQSDKPHPEGREVWGAERVKEELRKRGGSPLDNASSISIGVDFISGKTTSISTGGITASGSEFKDWFNLRAPANIQIVGPLFNVEQR